MTNIFLTVTDLELTASQAVKVIFVLILIFGIVFNLFKAFKADTVKWKILRVGMALFFMVVVVPVFKWIRIEGSLLSSPKYTAGTTIGFCQAFAKGKGIEFEYEVNGREYRSCNTFHPIPIDSIEVPGGRYLVRYSEQFPEEGRMDFHKKAR
jgi:hypothetical protein